MAFNGIHGILHRLCGGCSNDDLDTYPAKLWYVPSKKNGGSADVQPSIRITGPTQEDCRTGGFVAGKWSVIPQWPLSRLIRQDNSDPQYRSFRSNLSALIILATTYLGCSAVYAKLVNYSVYPRTIFIAAFSIIMLIILHGSSTIKILLILGLNYKLAKMEKKKTGLLGRYWPGIVIFGNMLVLFLNERNDGYRFSHLHGAFEVVVSL
jgi:hypothetical protein